MSKYRSAAAQAYRSWYKLPLWRSRRAEQLRQQPLCVFCMAMDRATAANTADHIEPHRGDWLKFSEGDLQSLCETCHATAKQAEENQGFSNMSDASGWPIDPRHPANAKAK